MNIIYIKFLSIKTSSMPQYDCDFISISEVNYYKFLTGPMILFYVHTKKLFCMQEHLGFVHSCLNSSLSLIVMK